MTESFWLGMVIVFMSGAVNGCFPLPMKYSRDWGWENNWIVFSFVAWLVLPSLLARIFVPHLSQVYSGLPLRAVLLPAIFGFLWGVSQVTLGLSFKAMGVAFAFSVMAGINALFGALIPLLAFTPADLFRPRGILLLTSIPILVVGLCLYGRAGARREKEQVAHERGSTEPKTSFAIGLALCIFTGVFGAFINLGFAFGGDVMRKCLELGANPVAATYAVWALVCWAGVIPNILYCCYLLFRNRTWRLFAGPSRKKESVLALAMAVLWVIAIFSYGVGATMIGKYGTSVGYTLLVAMTILSSTSVGVLTGEWKGTLPQTRRLLATAMSIVLVSVLVLNAGRLF
jgi:L-rhamnose-H+ transport protein